jgi:hypothetical protein
MRTVVRRWSGLGFVGRVAITVLTGVTWAVRSLQAVLFDPDYWNPVTSADFFAVYSYSAAFLLTAASLLILRGAVRPAPELSTAILVVTGACVVTGIANGVEDGLGLRGFGPLYVIGILVSGLGMFVIAAMFRTAPARELTFVPALGGLAMVLMTIGGGLLGLPAWLGFGAILVRERWSPRTATSEA